MWPFRRKDKHKHTWVQVATSMSGWALYVCIDCGEKEIG